MYVFCNVGTYVYRVFCCVSYVYFCVVLLLREHLHIYGRYDGATHYILKIQFTAKLKLNIFLIVSKTFLIKDFMKTFH